MIRLAFILFVFSFTLTFGQTVPDKFNYQIAIRDQNGNMVSDGTKRSFRISILDNPNSSGFVYRETFIDVMTKFGVANFQIGTGSKEAGSTPILSIPFLDRPYYIKVEVDNTNLGTNYTLITMPPVQLISVPFAIVAKESGSTKSLNPNLKINLNQLSTIGAVTDDIIKLKGGVWVVGKDNSAGSYNAGNGISIIGQTITNTGDLSNTNEIQTLSYSNNRLSISGGNYVDLPQNSNNYWSLTNNTINNTNTASVLIGTSSLPSNNPKFLVKGNSTFLNSNNQVICNIFSNNNNGNIEVASPSSTYYNTIGYFDGTNRPVIGIGSGSTYLAGFSLQTNGTFALTSNLKNFVLEHPKDKDKVIVYACIEGPEAAAYERGTAKLINGRAEVLFSEHFGIVVNPLTITINLTPISLESKGLAIIEKSADKFTIGELNGGKGNYSFDWEVKGVRKGYEDYRVIRDKSEYQIKANNETHVKPSTNGQR